MRISRKVACILLGLIALFCAGAVLGSYIPNIPVYAIVAGCSVAVLIIGLWFYNGHIKEEFEDVSSNE